MMVVKKLLSGFRKKKNRRQVYALVGRSGSGKSFRAKLVTEKNNIEYIIDDGLLIHGQRILAGRSAKREKSRYRAVKRAIFFDSVHADEVRTIIEKENIRSILILGTSERMIDRIVNRLGLPYPDKLIYIEDIATEDEILRARESRRREGKHVIPVPVIEVRRDPGHHILDSFKIMLKGHPLFPKRRKMVEKTVVQPPFSRRGKLSISESALSQMIMHCVQEYEADVQIDKIIIIPETSGYKVEIKLSFQYGINIPEVMSGLQEYIIKNIERYSGIHFDELNLTIGRFKSKQDTQSQL